MKNLLLVSLGMAFGASQATAHEETVIPLDYSAFDRDVQALVQGATPMGTPLISGFLQVRYDQSEDRPIAYAFDLNGDGDTADPGESGVNDLGGFFVRRARVALSGHHGHYGYHVEVDTSVASILREAYIDIPIENLTARTGLYKSGVSRNSLVRANELFFIERSEIGQMFEQRDTGVTLSGSASNLGWSVTVQNGRDTTGDELFLAGRVVLDFMGRGANLAEGALGGSESLGGTASISYFDDASTPDGTGWIGEVHMSTDRYSWGVEAMNLDDGGAFATPAGSSIRDTRTPAQMDGTPVLVYGTYMFSPDRWEGGLRIQDLDDSTDTRFYEGSLSRYVDGHRLKYSLGFVTIDSDNIGVDGNLLQASVQLSF